MASERELHKITAHLDRPEAAWVANECACFAKSAEEKPLKFWTNKGVSPSKGLQTAFKYRPLPFAPTWNIWRPKGSWSGLMAAPSCRGLSFILGGNPNKMIVKLNAGDFENTIKSIENIWNKIAPGQPFGYYFMTESFNETYRSELRLGSIFMTFTVLSIFIACLGLFGLAAFNAEKRTKEIGIKKVLGASIRQITYQLSIDFLKLVGIAIVVSLPLSWYVMDKWLEDFSYRIEISWWILVVAAFLAISISILTVSYQSIKAAIMNPVNSLRSD
jgi:hypothetical protein